MALADFAVSAFVTLLLGVDPVGLVPSFISATHCLPEKDRDMIALRAPVIASVIMVGLALFGNWLLHQLGIGCLRSKLPEVCCCSACRSARCSVTARRPCRSTRQT
jgi:small neutral amino acid transporter SnatA (MarC family)